MKSIFTVVPGIILFVQLNAQLVPFVVQTNVQQDLVFVAVKKTSDQIITAGTVYPLSGTAQGCVLSFQPDGTINWIYRYPEPLYHEELDDMDADNASIYTVGTAAQLPAGYNYSYVSRLDPNGNCLWKLCVDSANNAWLSRVRIMPDGGCIATGIANNAALNTRGIIVRLDSSGNVLWSHGHNISGRRDCFYEDVSVDNNGNVYCVGFSTDFSLYRRALIIKYSATGQLLWSKELTLPNQRTWFTRCEFLLNRLYIGGTADVADSSGQPVPTCMLLYCDTSGAPYRSVIMDAFVFASANIFDLAVTSFNTLAVSGMRVMTDSAATQYGFIGEFDADSLVFMRGTRTIDHSGIAAISTHANDLYYAGSVQYNAEGMFGAMDYNWYPGCGFIPCQSASTEILLQESIRINTLSTISYNLTSQSQVTAALANTICKNPVGVGELPSQTLSAFPNPCDQSCRIQFSEPFAAATHIELVDACGKILLSEVMEPGMQSLDINTSTLSPGIYFLRSGNGFISKIAVAH